MTENRGRIRPAPDGTPGDSHHETSSAMLRRAAQEGARHAIEHGANALAAKNPLLARMLKMIGGGMIYACAGGATGYAVSTSAHSPSPAPTIEVVHPAEPEAEPEPEGCDPLLVQHIMAEAIAGEALAQQLEGDDLHAYADRVRDLVSIDRQPDDLKICALLIRRKTLKP